MLYVIRGLPGSGKTTLAKQMVEEAKVQGYDLRHFEADQHFEKPGYYKFNAKELPQAHAECLENTKKALAEGLDVVVSNTFTTLAEIQPYFEAAATYKCGFTVLERYESYRNIHGVPEHTIQRMRQRWENLTGPEG